MSPAEEELSRKLLNTQDRLSHTQEKLVNIYEELIDLRKRVRALENDWEDAVPVRCP